MAAAAAQSAGSTRDVAEQVRSLLERERLDDVAWEAMAESAGSRRRSESVTSSASSTRYGASEYPAGWRWDELPEGAREALEAQGHTAESHRARGAGMQLPEDGAVGRNEEARRVGGLPTRRNDEQSVGWRWLDFLGHVHRVRPFGLRQLASI